MRKVHDVNEVFGHEYWTSIDEQLNKWDNEPFEFMMEMDIAEAQVEEEERRAAAYKAIAEKLHNEMEELRVAYLSARDAYIKWSQVCVEKGVF